MKNEVIASLLHGEENSVKTEKKVIQPLPVAEDTTLQYLFPIIYLPLKMPVLMLRLNTCL